jgi:hypothetical protein
MAFAQPTLFHELLLQQSRRYRRMVRSNCRKRRDVHAEHKELMEAALSRFGPCGENCRENTSVDQPHVKDRE